MVKLDNIKKAFKEHNGIALETWLNQNVLKEEDFTYYPEDNHYKYVSGNEEVIIDFSGKVIKGDVEGLEVVAKSRLQRTTEAMGKLKQYLGGANEEV